MAEVFTLREAVARGAEFLKRKGVESARLDSELLVGSALGMDRLKVYLNLDRPMSEAERDAARVLLQRRAAHEPVAYIVGRREFRSRQFTVSKAVLVPRPETELIVDIARHELDRRFPEGNLRVLEFGTGSGAIAVSLAAEIERVHVVATEQSAGAADIALENVRRHGVDAQVTVRVQRDFAGIAPGFHAIVTNPPYIAESERATLPPDVVQHEPAEALFAGADGLDAIRFLVREAPALLVAGGFLLTEIGAGMAEAVERVATAAYLRPIGRYKDYAGIERFVMLEAEAT